MGAIARALPVQQAGHRPLHVQVLLLGLRPQALLRYGYVLASEVVGEGRGTGLLGVPLTAGSADSAGVATAASGRPATQAIAEGEGRATSTLDALVSCRMFMEAVAPARQLLQRPWCSLLM